MKNTPTHLHDNLNFQSRSEKMADANVPHVLKIPKCLTLSIFDIHTTVYLSWMNIQHDIAHHVSLQQCWQNYFTNSVNIFLSTLCIILYIVWSCQFCFRLNHTFKSSLESDILEKNLSSSWCLYHNQSSILWVKGYYTYLQFLTATTQLSIRFYICFTAGLKKKHAKKTDKKRQSVTVKQREVRKAHNSPFQSWHLGHSWPSLCAHLSRLFRSVWHIYCQR